MSRARAPRVVVVTGASSGIGRATAHALATKGDDVVLAARSEETLLQVARECRDRGGRALVVVTDVSDPHAVDELVRRTVAELGRIDAWVNAAAVWSYGRFEDTPAQVFRKVVDTTLFGQVHGARAVLPQFRAQGRGVLVNVASLYGRVSSPYVAPYVTAKWGLRGFSEVLRQELRGARGIAVCTVLPGAVDTPIYRHAANYVGRQIRPLPPVVPPERVAEVIVRLLDRPRPEVVVGRVQHVGAWVHDLFPRLYDRLVGPVVRLAALRTEPAEPDEGTVFSPRPATNAVDDGWRQHDHEAVNRGLYLAATAATAATGTAATWAVVQGVRRARGAARRR